MGPILIVDDDAAVRSLIQDTLEEGGYTTISAHNGQDALHILETTRPECILLDLNMPVLDGYGVLHGLAERRNTVPVLLMTSDSRGQRLGPSDGVVGHVPKPFNLDDLVGAVTLMVQAYPMPIPTVTP